MRMLLALSAALLGGACGRIGFDGVSAGGDGLPEDGPPVLSCSSLAPTCGPTGTSSCCDSSLVPGGMFYRSYDGIGFDNMWWPAQVSSFRLDRYEVTVGRFRAYVEAGSGTRERPPVAGAGARMLNGMPDQGGWDPEWNTQLPVDRPALLAAMKCDPSLSSWTDTPGDHESRPMGCLSWYDAMAFCVWDGGFLPTNAEWNYAASGGNEQRAYPWSKPANDLTIDRTRATFREADCNGDEAPGCQLTDLIPVGSRPAGDGRWGHADLGGNIFEWVLDGYEPSSTEVELCVDCAILTPYQLDLREQRGGAFTLYKMSLLTSIHAQSVAGERDYTHGVRCARAR